MRSNAIHSKLLEAIRERVPQNQIVDKLVDILSIGKEAVYRRLRAEVFFTMEEMAAIALEFSISLDIIVVGCNHPNNRPFQLKTTTYVDPSPTDYYQMNEWVEILKQITLSPNLEMGESGNVLDTTLYYPYLYLCRLYHFKWQYQWRKKGESKPFDEIIIPDKLRKLQLEHVRLSKEVKKTYYIWDHMIFQYIANDILYFRNIHLISNEDVQNIKQDLLKLIDYLEKTSQKGRYETGNMVQFYISNINSDGSYSYYQSEKFNLTMIKAFTMNALASTDERTTNEIKEWIMSQKRLATLISESGEMQRISFFKKQREIIASI